VEEAVDAYVDESYAKSVVVLPLRKPGDPNEGARSGQNAEMIGEVQVDREIIGALIVEQIETDLPREIIDPRIDLVYEHSTRAMSNAIDVQNVFLMPLWKAIGKSTMIVKGRNLPKTLIVVSIILAVLGLLFLWRTDFDLKSDGTLQPAVRRDVFFDTNGTITEVLVKDGDLVKGPVYGPDGKLQEPGTLLVKMTNHELEQEWQKTFGQLQETMERLESLRMAKLSGELSKSEEAQISGEFLQLNEREKNLQAQLNLIKEKREKLEVRSPIAGQVLLPWDADQSLLHRPVMTGQKVMTIADPNGDWELELAMPERRMGHVTTAQEKIKPNLDVSYVLQTDPNTTRTSQVKTVYGITQVKGEEGPTVKMIVGPIKNTELYEPRPGTTLTAKINCGRCSLGYSWFHEAFEWVQKHILF
jgi:hypothetical protein